MSCKHKMATVAVSTVISLFGLSIAFADDSFYYFDGNEIPIIVSQERLIIQFDSTQGGQHGGAQFLTAHPCLTSEPNPTYLGRDYWIYTLQNECSYAAAASDLMNDPEVHRVSPVYLTGVDSSEFYVTDLVAVRFEDNLSIDSAMSLVSSVGLQLFDTSEFKHNLWRCALADTSTANPVEVGNDLHELSGVEWACVDVFANGKRHGLPSDPYFENQYYLYNVGQTGGTSGIDIRMDSAWAVALQDSSVILAVIDEGVTYHRDLHYSRILAGFDAAGGFPDSLQYDFDPTPSDTSGHGMACAGIIAAAHNDTGTVGVFGSCRIVPVKIFFDNRPWSMTYGYDVGQAIYFAAAFGAKVISCSWEFGTVPGWPYIADAIRDAVSPNPPSRLYACVLVFSAGNRAEINKHRHIGFPGNMAEVITVGAVDKYAARWSYSQYGEPLDFMAPSGDKGEYWNEPGDIWTVDLEGAPGINPPKFYPAWEDIEDVDYTGVFGGTSAAAPQVAGIAALMIGARPDLVTDPAYRDTLNRVIKNILRSTATDIGDPGYDTLTGAGIVNAYEALLPVIYGSGDLNNDGRLDAVDMNLLIDVCFFGGHAVLYDGTADVDCSLVPDALDLNYMIDFLFNGGPRPRLCL